MVHLAILRQPAHPSQSGIDQLIEAKKALYFVYPYHLCWAFVHGGYVLDGKNLGSMSSYALRPVLLKWAPHTPLLGFGCQRAYFPPGPFLFILYSHVFLMVRSHRNVCHDNPLFFTVLLPQPATQQVCPVLPLVGAILTEGTHTLERMRITFTWQILYI